MQKRAFYCGVVFSATFGLKSFLLSNNFIDGGVTGVSMLLASAFKLPLSVLLLVINLPLVALVRVAAGYAGATS
ncbi:YitT family protein [Hymenobacter lapidarius]|uniref:YitT family protein n=1 Tax=Hymenobacter lapidarius TaxID=1908237 RepID=UPI0009F55336|nr:YitT family protein [Hymenobacter lapidarius]